jgi:predicted RNA binding protein YcfA (HicA-like mRNA interferase family)
VRSADEQLAGNDASWQRLLAFRPARRERRFALAHADCPLHAPRLELGVTRAPGPVLFAPYGAPVPIKVREAIRTLEAEGWTLARTRGSHRQYRHPERPGVVTIPGKPSDTLHPKTWASIQRQAGLEDKP